MCCNNTVKDCCNTCYRNKTCVGSNWYCKYCKKDKDTCSYAKLNKCKSK